MFRTLLRSGLKLATVAGLAKNEESSPDNSRQRLRHLNVANIVEQHQSRKQARILDVGCGRGGLSAILRSRGYSNISGCDWLSPEQVDAQPEGFSYRRVDLNTNGLDDYEDATFDTIVCSDVLEHVENPARMLRDFSRVLEREGTAIISLPNAFNVVERMSWAMGANSTRYKTEKATDEFGHISILSSNVLTSLANRAGLEIIDQAGGYFFLDGYFIAPRRNFSPLFSYNIVWVLRKC